MISVSVELSGESPDLARLEARSAVEALGGRMAGGRPEFPGMASFDLPDEAAVRSLAGRLALGRRCLVRLATGPAVEERLATGALGGRSAAVRRVGRPSGPADPAVLAVGRAFVALGGRIDLERPEHRYWLSDDSEGREWLFEEAAGVDRTAVADRRMTRLPFQRPVSLPPRLGLAAANLARVRPGDRVLDPFLGTGALLAEAGLLGARVYGIDTSATMVRGALRNLAHLKVSAEELLAGDAGEVEFADPGLTWDAVLTDPPYGRSSSTGGEPPSALLDRVLPRWSRRVRPGGRVVLVVPYGAPETEGLGRLAGAVPLRVHRSLTREFRVYDAMD